MYSPRLYKHRDSYVLYIPTVHAFGSLLLTHTILVQTNIHDVSAPLFTTSLIINNFLHPRLAVQIDFLDTSIYIHKLYMD